MLNNKLLQHFNLFLDSIFLNKYEKNFINKNNFYYKKFHNLELNKNKKNILIQTVTDYF